MKRHRFLSVLACTAFCTFQFAQAVTPTEGDNNVLMQASAEQQQGSFKERALEYIGQTRPVQWIAWALNKHEKESTSNTRIILVRNDMPSFIQADPENLECIDPRIVVANQTTMPDNTFKPILIHKDAAVCPFRLRKTRTPLAVSGQWVVHPSRKTADLSSIVIEALDQVVNNQIHFDGFCVTHWIPCLNYSINEPVIDPFFNS